MQAGQALWGAWLPPHSTAFAAPVPRQQQQSPRAPHLWPTIGSCSQPSQVMSRCWMCHSGLSCRSTSRAAANRSSPWPAIAAAGRTGTGTLRQSSGLQAAAHRRAAAAAAAAGGGVMSDRGPSLPPHRLPCVLTLWRSASRRGPSSCEAAETKGGAAVGVAGARSGAELAILAASQARQLPANTDPSPLEHACIEAAEQAAQQPFAGAGAMHAIQERLH